MAQHLNDGAKLASNETRIQDFFHEVDLNYLAVLLVGLRPGTDKLRLCLDRTEWDFGQCQVNSLLVTVGRGDCHWPLCWELPHNRSGNSNAADRAALALGNHVRPAANHVRPAAHLVRPSTNHVCCFGTAPFNARPSTAWWYSALPEKLLNLLPASPTGQGARSALVFFNSC